MAGDAALAPKARWTLEEAAAAPLEPGRASPSLFRHGQMNLRWYAPRGRDTQTPHEQDEVYLVARGRGRFFVAGLHLPFGPGDLLFVPAGVEHRFEDFTGDFGAWVLFWGPPGGEGAGGEGAGEGALAGEGPPAWRWTLEDARRAPREPDDPLAARLFGHGSMSLWWYAPRERDPQQPHDQDEIYFVAGGRGSLRLDGQRLPVAPWDALFVPAGAEHRFEDFGDDLDLWAVFWGPRGGEGG